MVTNKCVLTGSEEDLEAVLKEVELAAVYNRTLNHPKETHLSMFLPVREMKFIKALRVKFSRQLIL